MICPKCGFSQPDDYYCASCGIHIASYVRKRERRRYRSVLALALVGAAAILLFEYGGWRPGAPGTGTVPGDRLREKEAPVVQARPEGFQRQGPAPGIQPLPREEAARPGDNARPEKAPQAPRSAAGYGSTNTQARPQLQAVPPTAAPGSDLTARAWFERGKALDDDSDAEIQCYLKALELDPKFAPAHFRLGAIYYRQAEDELAEREFTRFLKYASDADKQTYDIYVYYSPDYLEQLLREEEEAKAPPEEAKKEAAGETGEKGGGAKAEKTGTETGEEVQAVIKFSTVSGHIVVPVLLNGSLRANLLFDTGAEVTVISRELAERLSLRGDAGRTIRLQTIAGRVQAPVGRLDSIEIAGLNRDNFPVAVADLTGGLESKFDGMLGMDFLKNYTIRIDTEGSRILLTPRGRSN